MATSGKGADEGGKGGKFRKKPFRAPATPYERPPNALRNPIQAAKHVLKSKVVDPATRILARSAHNLFASLFRKRLTAPPVVPEATRESRDEVQQANTVMQSPGSGEEVRVSNDHANRSSGSGNNGINEIEEVLRKKTFSKAEIDRLTELLRARTVNVTAEDDTKRPDPTTSHMGAANGFQAQTVFSAQANKMESQKSLGGILTTAGNSNVLKMDVASAAELGKAYMGPSNASPSHVGWRSQTSKKDVPLLSNVSYTAKPSSVSHTPNFAVGVSENGYTMSRPRGRSAIYNMARTPHSRVYDATARKIDGYVASSSSPMSLENNTLSSGKQALKRRSSILDSDIGSIGPIRRIRQKTNMLSSPNNLNISTSRNQLSISENADGSDIARGSRSGMQKQMFLNGSKDNTSDMHYVGKEDSTIHNYTSVPPRSSEMAERILQQLDQSVSSPKEKLSELKLAVAREKSPTKLTHNMLNGRALRSLEDLDSSKLKDDASGSMKGSQLREARDSVSDNRAKFDNGDHVMNPPLNNKLAPTENGLETKALNDNVLGVKISDSAISSTATRPSQEKRAFRMSAHEDFVDFDDDSDNGGVDLSTEKEKPDKSSVDTKIIAAETAMSESQSVPSEIKSSQTSYSKERVDAKYNVVSTLAEKDGSFTFPVTPAPGTMMKLTSPAQSPPVLDAPHKEITDVPILSFDSKNVDKAGPFKFSSKSSGDHQSSLPTFGAQSESKLTESSTASPEITVAVTDTPKVPISDESDNGQKSRNLFGDPENFAASTASTTNTMNIFSSGPSASNPKINGPFSESRSASSAVQVSNGFSDVVFSSATSTSATVEGTGTGTSAATSVSSTISNPSTAGTTLTSSAASLFKFGSNSTTVPTNSASLAPSTSGAEPASSDLKDKKESTFSSFTNPSFGASSSSGFTNMGSSMFGFGASTASSTSNLLSSTNQSQDTKPFGTTVGSLFGAQGAPAETKSEAAPVTQSLPTQFGFSSSSSTVGQSASSSVSSGTSLFGSATPASNLFASSSGFGLSSSTSMGTSSFTSSSSTSLFGSSLPSSTSSIFGSAASGTAFSFGASSAASSSAASAPGFSFGASSAASSSAASAPGFSFGASPAASSAAASAPGFSFGASSSAASAPGFSFGASSAVASRAATAVGFSFGASSATAAPVPSVTGFSFGASSAPAATASPVFGSSLGSSSAPSFSFGAAASTTSASVSPTPSLFGTPSSVVQFGSTNGNDQVNMEDSMAEDTVQASNHGVTPNPFGQPANSTPPTNFAFGSGAPSVGSPFQFGGQQNLGAPQNQSPFQSSGNFDFSAGSSFSLGTGGGDKANRKIVRPKRDKSRKR